MPNKIDPETQIINYNEILIPKLKKLAIEEINDGVFNHDFTDFLELVSNLSEEKVLQYKQILEAQFLQKKRLQSYCEQISVVRIDYHKSFVNNERVLFHP